jgi:hypothetical protein
VIVVGEPDDAATDDGDEDEPHAASPTVASVQAAIDSNSLGAGQRVRLACDMVLPLFLG